MLDVIIGTLAGAAIGSGCTYYYMLHWREKYRVCRIERAGNEALVTQLKPRRGEGGRFIKKVAA